MKNIDKNFFKSKQKKRNYLHFDEKRSSDYLYSYVTKPSNIIRHSFYPFISYNLNEKKIRQGYIRITKSRQCPQKGYISPEPIFKLVKYPPCIIHHKKYPFISYKKAKKYPVQTTKNRLINYAGYLDSAIYAYYTELLTPLYEKYLINNTLEDTVTAYRKIERTINGKITAKCNIHFSKDVFSIIDTKKDCLVLCFDISKFFDTIDHEILKNNWCSILGMGSLPDDHYKVYKSLTRFSSVDRALLYKELGLSLKSKTLNKRYKSLCTPKDFRKKIRKKGLIFTNKTSKGIPQGSPLSGLLSNIYMMNFDKQVKDYLDNIDGSYFRYSDDMIFIISAIHEDKLSVFIRSEINKLKIVINDKKTQKVIFNNGKVNIDPSSINYNNPSKLQYLGLLYDGDKVFLRETGISKYKYKTRKAIRMRTAHYRNLKSEGKLNRSKIYRRTLHSRFTYIGKRNYISYVFRVSKVHNSKNVKTQVKGHYNLFKEYLNKRI